MQIPVYRQLGSWGKNGPAKYLSTPISSGSLRLPLSLTLAAFTEREHQARGRAGCVHRHSSSWDACCNSNHRLNVTDVEGEDKLPLHPSQSPTLLASLQENLRIVLQKPTQSWFETPHAEGFVHLGREQGGRTRRQHSTREPLLSMPFIHLATTALENRAWVLLHSNTVTTG